MTKFREIEEKPRRLYAVGDIHACPEELRVLLLYLQGQAVLGDDDLVIFIGDYIDRGPDAKGVIDQLLKFQREFPQTIFLRGNHEDMFMGFLGLEGSAGAAYLANGGGYTLASYGIESEDADDIFQSFPPEHLSFLLNLDSYALVGEYVFVHAGLNPERDLRAQLNSDLFWIRNDFITKAHPFSKTVVFGHTPHQDVLFDFPYKVGIDTGLVYGGRLTCLEMYHQHVFQVQRGTDQVYVSTFEQKIKGIG